MASDTPEAVARRFVDAFNDADLETLASSLSEDLVASITERDGGSRKVHGRAAYMASVEALDSGVVRPRALMTQLLSVADDQVLVMVEIKAERKGRTLHNHAAFLMTIAGGEIQRMDMVEALPEESDTFWNS